MRVTIKGLTDSTITFNTLGIILRGNSSKVELYPNSVAKHIDIKTEDQMRELICLKNAKLIEVIDETNPAPSIPIATKNVVIQPIQPVQPTQPKPEVKPPVEEIEDAPVTQDEEIEDDVPLTVSNKKQPKKVGRPKKNVKAKVAKVAKVKSIKRIEAPDPIDKEDGSKIVVMTPNGPIEGNAINNMSGEIPESEATRASIEALKQMEEEERGETESLVDESKLDVSERMGEEVVVATGENSITKIAMKNSILPEADSIKNRGIQWISPDGEDSVQENLDESIKDIFIDGEDPKDGDEPDNFIEC